MYFTLASVFLITHVNIGLYVVKCQECLEDDWLGKRRLNESTINEIE